MATAAVAAIVIATGVLRLVRWGLGRLRKARLPKRLRTLELHFRLPESQLRLIMDDMQAAMNKGLLGDQNNEGQSETFSEVKMLPAHITSLPSGDEAGDFVTVDLGGERGRNLRDWILVECQLC